MNKCFKSLPMNGQKCIVFEILDLDLGHPVPLQKLFESSSVSESGSAYADVFFKPQVFNLQRKYKNYAKNLSFRKKSLQNFF